MHVARVGALAASVAVLLSSGAGVAAAASLPQRTAAASAAAAGPQVLVVAVPDLRWSDVSPSATPALWQLLARGSAGALSVKSAYQLAGCADGLLTLGAGDRVAAEPGDAEPTPCSGPTTGQTAELARQAADRPALGALGRALHTAGLRTATLGPAARLVLPDADIAAPGTDLAAAGDAAVVVAVEDQIYAGDPAQRASDVGQADTAVGALVDQLPATATVLLVGSSDGAPDPRSGAREDAHLHVAVAAGPGFGPGYLTSPSTKRPPYVELIDVAPTILDRLHGPVPAELVGRPWQHAAGPTAPGTRAAHLADLDDKAVQGARWRPLFMWALAVAALVVVLAGLLVADGRGGAGVRRAVTVAGLLVAALPVVSWLVQLLPWWRWPVGLLPVLLVAGAAAVAAAASMAGRRVARRSLVTVTAVSAAVLVLDLLTGSALQTSALLGDSPITAGRFYGAGNTAFGVLAVSTLLGVAVAVAAPADAPRRTAVGRAAVAGVLVAVAAGADAAPTLGADLGGALALMPSALVLVLLLARVRLGWRRGLAAVVAGLVPLLALALWDYHRPADQRTHIGRFVAQVLDGEAGPVVGRKISANLGQLTGSPFLPLVAGAVVVGVLLWRRHRSRLRRLLDATPGLSAGLVAGALCAALGGLLNDSGVTVTGIMLAVALPVVTALALRADP